MLKDSESAAQDDPLREQAAQDIAFMRLALQEAQNAYACGEVPVGTVIVRDGEVIGTGFNRREQLQSPLAHAEIGAIEQAATFRASWRLTDCDLYVTFEPCIMCVGAILQARIGRLIFGCLDAKAGAVESLYKLCDDSRLNHRLPVRGGVLAQESAELLSKFFSELRHKKKSSRDTERWPGPAEGA
ncbi:MAG: nucleoside deaminase [Deltaproteobacteria bacterium]|nr:nucleoside deaminase [Deltaproteobacteria bacterium]